MLFTAAIQINLIKILLIYTMLIFFVNLSKITKGGGKNGNMASWLTLMIDFLCRPVPETEEEKQLLSKYCLPEADKFRLSEHLMHPPTKETYRIWMHEMLYIEEWAQMDHISR